MSYYKFTYQSDNFSLDKSYNARLFVKAGKSKLSFLIVGDGNLLAWKDKCTVAELAGDTALMEILALPYEQVVIGLIPDNLTLIPAAMYMPEHVNDYARFLDVKPEDKVFTALLDEYNQVIYRTDQNVPDILAQRFDLEKTVPADRGWIAAIAKSEPGNNHIYLDITDDQLSITNFYDGKLRFYNNFKAADVNDIIYYCLFVAKRLELQPDYSSLIISGQCAASDIARFNEFFGVVSYSNLKAFNIPLGVPAHQLLSLAVLS